MDKDSHCYICKKLFTNECWLCHNGSKFERIVFQKDVDKQKRI